MKNKVLIIGFMLLGLSYLLAQDELEVAVLTVEGQAQYKEPGADSPWKKLEAGAVLKKGYQIQTGLRAKALLRFSDATKIAVRSASFLEITEAIKQGDTAIGKINVDIGNLRVTVEKERKEKVDLKVATPQGTASVRGTDFMCNSYSDIGTSVFTLEGLVGITVPHGPYTEAHPVMPPVRFEHIMPVAEMMGLALKYMQVTGDNFKEFHFELPPDIALIIKETTFTQLIQLKESTSTVNLDPLQPKFIWSFNKDFSRWDLLKAYADPIPKLAPRLVNGEPSQTQFVLLDQFGKEQCALDWVKDYWKLSCVFPDMPCGFKQLADGTWVFECK